MKKIFGLFMLLTVFCLNSVNAQEVITESDQTQLMETPILMVPEQVLRTPIPSSVNNADSYYMPYVFYQEEYSCAQASSLVYLFTYELAVRRNRYVLFDTPYYKYHIPSHFAWNFYNNANSLQGVSFMDTWHLIRTAGSPFTPEWGDSYFGGATKWMTGYSKYYEGMKNRIVEMYAIPTNTETGINTLKHWIANHCGDNQQGGCANIFVSSNWPYSTLPSGTVEAGKAVYTYFSSPTHSITIVGYNDSIRYDFNNDGQYTNHIDLNGDGVNTVSDWEIGGVLVVNSHGPDYGNNGFAYLPYRLLAMYSTETGVWNSTAYVVQVRDEVFPQITYKATVTHDRRNMIKISAGIASDTNATVPEKTIDFGVFNYQGGPYYMRGADYNDGYKTLELGLDITPFLNDMNPDQPYKFFFIVDENDPSGLGTGQINSFSFMDYTGTTVSETACTQTNIGMVNNSRTLLSVVKSIHYTKPEITNYVVNTILNTDFQYQLSATQGKPGYRWDFTKEYTLDEFSGSFPGASGNSISLTSVDNGYALVDLPFTFPYYESEYQKICINANGYITFRYEQLNWPYMSSVENQNRSTRMIAPFLTDLVLSSVKVQSDTNVVSIYMQGKIKNEIDNSLRMVVKLYKNGIIEFYYGDMLYLNNSFESVVSRGDDQVYQKTPVSGLVASSCANRNFRFTPPPRIKGLYINRTGDLSGNFSTSQYSVPFSVTCYDNNEVKTSKTLYLNCTPEGIDQNEMAQFSIYPNPTTGIFKAEDRENHQIIKTLEIYDFQGKLLRTYNIEDHIAEVNISDLPTGVYIVKIATSSKVKWGKITKR